MNKISNLMDKLKAKLKVLGEKVKKQGNKFKIIMVNTFQKLKKSPRFVKTLAVYAVVLSLMFTFMAWQRSRISLNIIANDPPEEQSSNQNEDLNAFIPDLEENTVDLEESNEEEQEIESLDPEEVEQVFSIKDKIIWPIDGFREIEGRFKEKFNFRNGDEYFLDGILIPAAKGSKVRAALPGTVIDVGYSDLYGNVVKVRFKDQNDDVWECIYYNLEQIQVEEGQNISVGDSLGYVGSNLLASNFKEEHIIFELKKNRTEVDPEPYF